jgi:cysteinyl-tRNA synthetase
VSETEARRLAEQRAALRAARDFEGADRLRDRIAGLGYLVEDAPDGFVLVAAGRAEPAPTARVRPQDVDSVVSETADRDVTVHWIAEGWPDDVARGIASFRAHHGVRRVQHVVAEAVPSGRDWGPEVEVIHLVEGLGWARARNAGLERTRGRLVFVVDGSVEAAGDVFGPLEAAMDDPTVGVAGPVGAVTEDLREFVPAPGPECDAIEGYLMVFRRDLLERGIRFDPGFRFYRSADLELSLQIKALGLRAVAVDVPIERHEHRMWWTTSPADRRRWSKRNYYRFLDRWRGRTDLLVSAQSS